MLRRAALESGVQAVSTPYICSLTHGSWYLTHWSIGIYLSLVLIRLTDLFLRSLSKYNPHLNPMLMLIERLVTLIDQCLN